MWHMKGKYRKYRYEIKGEIVCRKRVVGVYSGAATHGWQVRVTSAVTGWRGKGQRGAVG